jgi:rod shape-determining protein MreC
MIKYLKEYRFYIILFLFLLIPVIAIDTSTRNAREYRFYDRVIIALTWPIQASISWTLDHLAAGFQNYVFLLTTRQDNIALTDENRKLQSLIASLQETQQENIRLRKLLDFQERFKIQSVVARVIAKDVAVDFRAIRVNRGESSGIARNMAVITNEGIVGRVLRTTRSTADIVTIVDPLSAVDAIDERSRARGVIEGLNEEACMLRYALRTDDIQNGDVLISSGLGGIFPKGIPIGTVARVNRKAFGITQDVEVRPSVEFRKIEEVLIVTHQDADVVIKTLAAGADEGKENTKDSGTDP